jgi:MOSC domain-containing protein YiiM
MNPFDASPDIVRLFHSPQPGAPMQARIRLQLRAGLGIEGDRHCGRADWPGQNLTLVEAEEIERFCAMTGRAVDLALTRRNVITRGVRLNDLVGRRFRIGDCVLLGIERCEPCSSLGQRLADAHLDVAAVIHHWLGRGGLRADVLTNGTISAGDSLEIIDPEGVIG